MDSESVSSCPDDPFTEPLQDWEVDPDCLRPKLNDSESEDVLHGVDPNEVFPSVPRTDTSSQSNGDIYGGPVSMVTVHPTPATVYQVVYDISTPGGAEVAPRQENMISIKLGGWSSPVLLSDSCVVSELPDLSGPRTIAAAADRDLLQLTDEEQRLLDQEGVSLSGNLPLTKVEERILRKVRRKIRNKQSAQDSRRRRREYIDSLESRAASCSVQNSELQRTVEQLEKHNRSLLAQLRQLQSLIKQSISKGAQTSTCLLIIFVSLALIILPTFSPFGHRLTLDDDLRPTGVISRNILTNTDDLDGLADQLDTSAPSSQLSLSGAPESRAILQDPTENQEAVNVTTQEESESVNGMAAVSGATDPAKPAHADEM